MFKIWKLLLLWHHATCGFEDKNCEDLYSTLAIKEDLAKKLGLEFPIRREEGSMRAARVLPEAPAGKDSVAAAPADVNQRKKQRKKGDAFFKIRSLAAG